MKSWEAVAGGRVEHIEIAQSGHMLVRDAPRKLAQYIAKITLPDFSSGLENIASYRAAYRERWTASVTASVERIGLPLSLRERAVHRIKSQTSIALSSPVFSFEQCDDQDVPDFELDMLAASASVTPKSLTPKQEGVQNTRLGNLQWRRVSSFGSKSDLLAMANQV